MDVQKRLDEWLAGNREVQRYVAALYYLDEGEKPPSDVTHVVSLASRRDLGKAVRVGVAVVPLYAFMADAVLSLIATGPVDA